MSKNVSIPSAIVLAGALIGGAVWLSKAPVDKPEVEVKPAAQVAGEEEKAPATPPPVKVRQISTERDHIRGNPEAEIAIIEYSDIECPFCKQFHNAMNQIIKENDDNIAWVYRHNPLDSLHPTARKEAVATECAAEQSKFWEYLDKAYETTPAKSGLTDDELVSIVHEINLDIEAFENCLSSDKPAQRVQEDSEDAPKKSTPYVIFVTPEKDMFRTNPSKKNIDGLIEQYSK